MTLQQRTFDRAASNLVIDCIVLRRRERAILCDISASGCRMELFDGFVQLGSTIIFELDERLAFAGEVVWTRGGEAGVQFTKPLPASIMTALEM
ncbi:hypothetical protein GRI34_12815 [Erythrobacter aquimaris]|uniref:PilZ domain-containing protein n=1 Tax=Qipengyuania aquimaris TaxID=255984 RepID=A0A6I4TPT3_9SPHN|nr:PilZ domain-containing protein [Qipengyuania aquimaris]MXO97299.1 hypothetical protein [Qipengyuania aquimaris]